MAKILIAENDEHMLEALVFSYREIRGHEVITAANPQEAVMKLEEKPDVVITDLRLQNDWDRYDKSGAGCTEQLEAWGSLLLSTLRV